MSAEAHYFAMYNTNCSVTPVSTPSTTSGPTPETCFFTMYNSNCSYTPVTTPTTPLPAQSTPETQYFSRYNSEVASLEAQRIASLNTSTACGHIAVRTETSAGPEAVASANELRPRRGQTESSERNEWPSEAFDEVPQGTMTISGFLQKLKNNLMSAEDGKPPGYLKAFAQKLFTFSATEVTKPST